MARAMEMKTPAEIRQEARIEALKRSIAIAESKLLKEAPEWADFAPCNKRAGVVKRARVQFHHQSNERIADKDLPRLLEVPTELALWVNSIAKPGERITLTVCW